MKIAKQVITLFLLTCTKMVQSKESRRTTIDVKDGETRKWTIGNSFPQGGKVRLVWRAINYGDEEYRLRVFCGFWWCYNTGEIDENEHSDFRVYSGTMALGNVGHFDVHLTCENESSDCDGHFEWALILCECPGNMVKTSDCVYNNVTPMSRAADAKCRASGISTEPIEGEWFRIEGVSGAAVSHSITHGTISTTGSTLTTTETESVSVAVGAKFSFAPFKALTGGSEFSVTVTGTHSSAVAQSIQKSLSVKRDSRVTVSCAPLEYSSTGLWYVYQWKMSQPKDSLDRPGFLTLTQNIICTESYFRPPACPVNFCGDTTCSVCLSPFEHLSATTSSPTPSPTTAPTTAPTTVPTTAPTTAPTSVQEEDIPFEIPTNCFSESTLVNTLNKGTILMKDLNVGDKILSGKNQYETVYAFGHREEKVESEFLQIHTSVHDSSLLEMTKEHLIFVEENGKQAPVRADSLKVGDTLVTGDSYTSVSVTNITTTAKKGLYMPLTESGTLMANGLKCSAYVSIKEDATSVVANKAYFGIASEDVISHWWLSPLRMLCLGVSPKFCALPKNETTGALKEQGIHRWLVVGQNFAKFADRRTFSAVFVLAVGLPSFLLFGGMIFVENIFGAAFAVPTMVMMAVALVWLIQKTEQETHVLKKKEGKGRKKWRTILDLNA